MQLKPSALNPVAQPANPSIGQGLSLQLKRAIDLRQCNTPQLLRRGLYGVLGLSLVWVPVSIGAIQNQRTAIKTISQDSVPSVLLAQRIQDAMADMDSMVANALLDDRNPSALIQDPTTPNLSADQTQFNKRRTDLVDRLTLAAKNITYPGEEEHIRKLTLDFGTYLAYVERAQAAHARGDKATMLMQYRLAEKLLDETLIPTARDLGSLNLNGMRGGYVRSMSTGISTLILIILLGFSVIGSLVAIQIFLSRRMRRTLNPLLLAATVVASIFLIEVTVSMVRSFAEIGSLTQDSFGSLDSLRTARSLLYGANSDESRYLLDGQYQSTHEQAFRNKITQVFRFSFDQEVLGNTIVNLQSQRSLPAMGGYFATALNNITFPGEREALTAMMQQYKEYLRIDAQIRELVAQGKQREAIDLCVSDDVGKSNWVFDRLKATMDNALDINQKEFDATAKQAMDQLQGFEIKAAIVFSAIVALTFLGLSPRLKEYA